MNFNTKRNEKYRIFRLYSYFYLINNSFCNKSLFWKTKKDPQIYLNCFL